MELTIFLLFVFVVIVALIFDSIAFDSTIVSGGAPKKTSPEYIEKDLVEFPASKFETQVRGIISRITGKKFPSVYPKWLRHNGKQLELDGYNADLKLAFESQGPQHTKFINKLDTSKSYKDRLDNDAAKLKLCDDQNVGLVIVDYKVPKHLLSSYIKSRIYDIGTQWTSRGLFDQVAALGILASKPGDYVELMSN